MANVKISAKVFGLLAAAMVFGLLMGHCSAQNCATELANLNVCAPFVVPGAQGSPDSNCCGALQSVEHDCICNTVRIASRLPSMCNLPPVNCGN